MKKFQFLTLLLVFILSLTATGIVLAATSDQTSGPNQPDRANPAEMAPGIPEASYVYTSSVSIPINDDACFTTTLTVPDSFGIGDLNVGIWLTHTYRGDLELWLTSPQDTQTALLVNPDDSADNLNVLLDDASPNLPDSTDHLAPPPYYYAWWMPDSPLAQFYAENSQGDWVLEVCDDAGGDTGTLYDWTLFFTTPFVSLEPESQAQEICKGSNAVYDLTLTNATGMTTAFDLAYTSLWPYEGPATSPVLADGESWDFQVSVYVPWASDPGDSDVLTVSATGGGETDSASLTTAARLMTGWQDYANTSRGTQEPSIVYYDGKLYKIGGYDGAAQAYLDIYDIATDTWTPGADLPEARYRFNCEAIDAKIYCAGGYSTAGHSTLYIYDIATDAWTTGASMSATRYDYASASVNGKYYVIGGFAAGYGRTIWEYDPASNTWNEGLPMMTSARGFHMAGVIGGNIYVAGGYNGSYLSSVEIFNTTTNTWSAGPSMPTTWLSAADAVVHDRYLILAGGDDNHPTNTSNLVWVFDAVNGTWSAGLPMNHTLSGAEAASDGNDYWMVGGWLYEGVFIYSPYTTRLMQCDFACTPVSGLDFTWDPAEPWANEAIAFDASFAAGSSPVDFTWDFDDGDSGAGQSVEHTFVAAGAYGVELTATNCDGANTIAVTHDVNVILPPTIAVDPLSLHATQTADALTAQPLEICDTGDYTLTWELGEVPDLPWTSQDPITGTLEAQTCEIVDVYFDSTGLALGDYYGDFEIASNDPAAPVTTVPVTLTVVPTVEFVYYDLEDVVQTGEAVYLAGDFNGWDPAALAMTPNGDYSVFSVSIPLAPGTYEYKYVVDSSGSHWDWLQSYPDGSNRSVVVEDMMTVEDYRDIQPGWYVLQWPPTTTTTVHIPTENIYGQIWAWGLTYEPGAPPALLAELGYGTDADPSAWTTWASMPWFSQEGENDQYASTIIPEDTGVFSYAVRFNGNWGVGNPNDTWYYGDTSGGEYDPADAGVLTVLGPSIELVKTVGTDPNTCATTDSIEVLVGTEVVYCYTVTNTGDLALVDHDLYDDQLGDLLVDFPYTLEPDASAFITATAVMTEGVVNTATWTAWDGDTHFAESSDTASVTVYTSEADLSLAKTGPATVGVGETFTYTLTITNAGPDAAVEVVLVDTLPEGVSYVTANASCVAAFGVVTCELGDIANEGSLVVEIVVTAPSVAGSITNNAVVSSLTFDSDETNNSASFDTEVVVGSYFTFLPMIVKN